MDFVLWGKEAFDLRILNGDIQLDHIIDPATGTAQTTLNFFMSSEGYTGGDKGIDANQFDECPIVLNDYGDVTEKCETWDCIGWSHDQAADIGAYCSGGWLGRN